MGQHRAHGRAAKHSMAAASGLQQPSNRRDNEENTASTGARAGAPAKLAGVDQAAWARSTGAELGGDGGDWRRRGRNPMVRRKRATRRSRGAIGRQRISPELAGVGRGARRRLSRQRGIRVRVRPRGERVRGKRPAGLSRFGQTHSG
jgi:hypothetical protein